MKPFVFLHKCSRRRPRRRGRRLEQSKKTIFEQYAAGFHTVRVTAFHRLMWLLFTRVNKYGQYVSNGHFFRNAIDDAGKPDSRLLRISFMDAVTKHGLRRFFKNPLKSASHLHLDAGISVRVILKQLSVLPRLWSMHSKTNSGPSSFGNGQWRARRR